MSPVCIEYARSFRKTIRVAVFLAECRCFCCAKMARGAAGDQKYCTVYLKNVSENVLFRLFIKDRIKQHDNERFSHRRMHGSAARMRMPFSIIFGFWLYSGREFALYAEEHDITKNRIERKNEATRKEKRHDNVIPL